MERLTDDELKIFTMVKTVLEKYYRTIKSVQMANKDLEISLSLD